MKSAWLLSALGEFFKGEVVMLFWSQICFLKYFYNILSLSFFCFFFFKKKIWWLNWALQNKQSLFKIFWGMFSHSEPAFRNRISMSGHYRHKPLHINKIRGNMLCCLCLQLLTQICTLDLWRFYVAFSFCSVDAFWWKGALSDVLRFLYIRSKPTLSLSD